MQYLYIKEPMWLPVPRVGISPTIKEDVTIEILFHGNFNKRQFPHKYFIGWDRLQFYPVTDFPHNLAKRMIPISMLEIIG